MHLLNFNTENGDIVTIEAELLQNVSGKIKSIIQKDGYKSLNNDDKNKDTDKVYQLPLHRLTQHTLNLIYEWAKNHQDDDYASELTPFGPILLKAWDCDKEFVDKLDKDELFEIILVSSALDIQELFNLGFQQIVQLVKRKSVKGIQEFFGYDEELTPEVKKALLKLQSTK